CSTMKVW
nr:immunoglobulin heavy chain junction region [Macaca mulatta]MOX92203.1 immunoglobulin heavy chain junction region [Macaca mulatta]MOX92404.1 immunoglobulin heavy chain junction region [Macaca mulatta]MOX92733.1 immunoglobulin heavy chain junction region [Macaca mulatta]MOX92839.1 immunoglobulin heavy chain junction region [Macaca mulatta]